MDAGCRVYFLPFSRLRTRASKYLRWEIGDARRKISQGSVISDLIGR
jgi:hypothetical protein